MASVGSPARPCLLKAAISLALQTMGLTSLSRTAEKLILLILQLKTMVFPASRVATLSPMFKQQSTIPVLKTTSSELPLRISARCQYGIASPPETALLACFLKLSQPVLRFWTYMIRQAHTITLVYKLVDRASLPLPTLLSSPFLITRRA